MVDVESRVKESTQAKACVIIILCNLNPCAPAVVHMLFHPKLCPCNHWSYMMYADGW